LTYAPVKIGEGAWLGAGCTILQGRNIGKGAVIGAGAVVTCDIPPFAIAIGSPAKVVSFRGNNNLLNKSKLLIKKLVKTVTLNFFKKLNYVIRSRRASS
jgi:serine acetyltransferase